MANKHERDALIEDMANAVVARAIDKVQDEEFRKSLFTGLSKDLKLLVGGAMLRMLGLLLVTLLVFGTFHWRDLLAIFKVLEGGGK